MRKVPVTITLGILGVAFFALPAIGQPVSAELTAIFARAGVDIAAVHVETPSVAAMPLIDAHNHLNANMSAESLMESMERAGVESMVLMPRHYRDPRDGGMATDEQALDYSRRYPGRFIPLVGGQRDDLGPRSIDDPRNVHFVLRELGDRLGKGDYRGLGEFILVHYAYDVGGGETGGEVRIRVDHDAMRRLAALAGKQRVPVVFHAEAEEKPAKEAEALIAAYPDTLFVWSHACGRASADETARRLRLFPNLMCDLGHMFNGPHTQGGYGKYWPRKTPSVHLVQDDAGRILPEMKQLFEAFPDRFMIGTDTAHTAYLKFYRYRIDMFRVMLAQLAPEAARKIGAENARRVFAAPAKRD
jgi:hypothetical protein